MKNKDTFVPIWKYCKENGIARQNVYRWIRENKVPKEKMRKVEKVIVRLEIDSTWQK